MKVNGIDVVGDAFAYDGCHKIYVCECQSDKEEAKEIGYEIIGIEYLEEVWSNSCSLRFIYNWELSEHYVGQFEDAEFEYDNY